MPRSPLERAPSRAPSQDMLRRLCAPAVGLVLACAGQIDTEEGEPLPGMAAPPGAGGSSARPPATPGAPTSPGAPTLPGAAAPGTPASAGTSAGSPPAPAAGSCRLQPQRLWRLTPEQVGRTVASLFPTTPAAALGEARAVADRLRTFQPEARRFSNEADHLAAPLTAFEESFNLARELGRRATTQLSALHACLPARLDDDACVRTAIGDFGGRAFRRPLEAAELDELITFFKSEATAAGGRAAGIGQVVHRLLLSPHFLLRSELGQRDGAGFRLTPHEIASALSFFLVDGPPDRGLSDAAASGALATRAGLEKEARRLLATPALGVLKLWDEQLDLALLAKRDPNIPNKAAVLKSMAEEPRRFVEHVLWKDGAKLATLLGAPYTLADAALAAHYGASAKPTTWERLPLTDRPGGLFTQASFLTIHKGMTDRGLFLRENVLCQPTPTPPANVETDLQKAQMTLEKMLGKTLTAREVRERHMADPACSGCHNLIDPLGAPLDAFDVAGRVLKTPVDTRGAVAGTPATDGPVKDAAELVKRLAASPDVMACTAQRVFEYALGHEARPTDACALRELATRLTATGGDLVALVVDVITSDAFTLRSPMEM